MSTTRNLSPSKGLIAISLLITAIVGYAVYYAFTEGSTLVKVVAVAAIVVILLPIIKMPIRVHEDDESIRVQQLVGEKVFSKKDYSIDLIEDKRLFRNSIRMFATSIFLHLGYFRSKTAGDFYAQCVGDANFIMLTNKSDGSKTVIDAPARL